MLFMSWPYCMTWGCRLSVQMHRKLFPFWGSHKHGLPSKFSCPEEFFHWFQFSSYLSSLSFSYFFFLHLYSNFAINSLGILFLLLSAPIALVLQPLPHTPSQTLLPTLLHFLSFSYSPKYLLLLYILSISLRTFPSS